MNIDVKFAFFLSLCLLMLIFHAGAGAAKSPPLTYPDSLLLKMGINEQEIIKNQKKFNNNPIHTQWMNHINDVLPEISPEKKETIIKTHTSLLFIKDRLDTSFFNGNINKQEFTTRLAELMKWFQETSQSVLSEKESNALFGISGQDDELSPVTASYGELGFPINNPQTTVEMVREKFDARTITDISRFYQDHARELRDIKKIYETGGFRGEEAKQIKNDMLRTEKELQAAFKNYCRDILSDEQFVLLFGNEKPEKK